MIKTINIIGCPDHRNYLNNKLELALGFHGKDYHSNCFGCLNHGLMWKANIPQHIFLTTIWLDNKENQTITRASYCGLCSVEVLEEMKRDFVGKTASICYCSLCSFNTLNKQDIISSPQAITLCFCAFASVDILGKLNQDIFDYQNEERMRGYRDLNIKNNN